MCLWSSVLWLTCTLSLVSYWSLPLHDVTCLQPLQPILGCNAKFGSAHLYATKTRYIVGRGATFVPWKPPPDCKAVNFFLVGRHATRYPKTKTIQHMGKTLNDLQQKILQHKRDGLLCEADFDSLAKWTFGMSGSKGNAITDTGRTEAVQLGQSFRWLFPNLFSDFSNEDFSFITSSKERTIMTAKQFARGLFNFNRTAKPKIRVNDTLASFHKLCKQMLMENGINETDESEQGTEFMEGPYMERIRLDVGKRVGFPITQDELKTIKDGCQYEVAIDGGSPWCGLLSEQDLKVFEYYEDLDQYYVDAYGNDRNYRMTCPLMKEVLGKLKNPYKKPGSTLIFTHSEVLKKVVAYLGLFKDSEPFKANQFCRHQHRKWRSSFLSPFNANLAFVVFECNKSNNFYVTTLLQEKPVVVKGCSSELCPIGDFMKHYEKDIENCDMNEICSK